MKTGTSFLLFLWLFMACQSEKNTDPMDFSRPQALTVSDSIAVEQILQPLSWTVVGDKAVLLSYKTDSLFFVYRLPDFEYLYSFGGRGEGPGDFRFPGIYRQVDSDVLCLSDPSKKVLYRYDVGDSTARRKETIAAPVYNCLLSITDSVYLVQRMAINNDGSLKMYYTTVCSDGKKGIDSTQILIQYKDYMNVPHGYNYPISTYKGNRLAVLYSDVRRADFFDISREGKISPVRSVGDPRGYEELQSVDFAAMEQGDRVLGIQGTEEYLYVLVGRWESPDWPRKIVNSYLEVYDWDGHPVEKFDLGRAFDRFLVDPAHGKIFCYDSDMDFEQVFVYDYKI